MSRTEFAAKIDKHRALRNAEEAGELADSMAVRHRLLERVRAGEISLAESQKELKRIQRGAKRNGLKTRSQVWRDA